MILGMAGGAMVGWQLGAALAGGDANWTVAGIGAGLIVVTFPITKSYNKKVNQAVEIYNESYKKTSFWQRSELKLGFTGNGVALALRF